MSYIFLYSILKAVLQIYFPTSRYGLFVPRNVKKKTELTAANVFDDDSDESEQVKLVLDFYINTYPSRTESPCHQYRSKPA